MKLQKHTMQFRLNGKLTQFTIEHNLPNTHGMDIDNAIENWANRTKEYTAESLCNYIKSKDGSNTIICNPIN